MKVLIYCLLVLMLNMPLIGQQMEVEGALQISDVEPSITLHHNDVSLDMTVGKIRTSANELFIESFYGPIRLRTSDSGFPGTKLFIDTEGEIGIGNFNPQRKLHITGNGGMLRLEGSTHANLTFYDGTIEDGAIGFGVDEIHDLVIRNYRTGFEDLIILHGGAGGKFYMYPDGKLYANNLGNIGDHKNMQWDETTGEIGWDNSSRRFKTNIQTLDDNWSKIFNARPVKYNRPRSPNHWEFGYVAEEMDSIGLSNLVGYDRDGKPDDVKYDRMVIYLTELIKLQASEIDDLRRENKVITSRLDALERRQKRNRNTKRRIN